MKNLSNSEMEFSYQRSALLLIGILIFLINGNQAFAQNNDLSPCVGEQVTYLNPLNTSGPFATVSWTISPSGGHSNSTIASNGNNTITWSAPGSYLVRVAELGNTSNSHTYSVSVQGAVGGTLTVTDSNICPGETVNFNVSGYSGSNFRLENTTTGQNYTSAPPYNNISVSQTSIFRFRAMPAAGCSGPTQYSDPITVTVNNYSPGTMSASFSGYACAGNSKTISVSSTGASSQLALKEVKWRYHGGSWNTIGIPGFDNSTTASFTANNTVEAYGILTFNNCDFTTPIRTIAFDDPANPNLGTISSSTGNKACVNTEAFTVSVSGSDASTITWRKNDGISGWVSLGSGTSITNQTIVSSTTFEATLQFANPCLSNVTATYTVDPINEQVGSINLNTASIDLEQSFNASYSGIGTVATYEIRESGQASWTPITLPYIPQEAKTYEVRALVNLECSNNVPTSLKTITVSEEIQTGITDVCTGSRVVYNQMTSIKTEWSIQPGSGYTKHNVGYGTDLDVSWNTPGIYQVTAYDLDNGDPDDPANSESFSVTVGPRGGVLSTSAGILCDGEEAVLTLSDVIGDIVEIENLTTNELIPWTTGLTVNPTETTSYRAKVTKTGCGVAYSDTLVIERVDPGTVSYTSSGTTCLGTPVNITVSASNQNPNLLLKRMEWKYPTDSLWSSATPFTVDPMTQTGSFNASSDVEVRAYFQGGGCDFYTPAALIVFDTPPSFTAGTIAVSVENNEVCKGEFFNLVIKNTDATSIVWRRNSVFTAGEWKPFASDSTIRDLINFDTQYEAILNFPHACASDGKLTTQVTVKTETVGSIGIDSNMLLGQEIAPAYTGEGSPFYYQVRPAGSEEEWVNFAETYVPRSVGSYEVRGMITLDCDEQPTASVTTSVSEPSLATNVPSSSYYGQDIIPVYNGDSGTALLYYEVSENGRDWFIMPDGYVPYFIGNLRLRPVVNLFGNINRYSSPNYEYTIAITNLPISFSVIPSATSANYGDYITLDWTHDSNTSFVKFQRFVAGEWHDIHIQPGDAISDISEPDKSYLRITEEATYCVVGKQISTGQDYRSVIAKVALNASVIDRSDYNYIAVTVPQTAQRSTFNFPSYAYGNTTYEKNEMNQAVQIFSGLGKEIQTIQVQTTTTGSDLSTLSLYDAMGRVKEAYLPLSTGTITGNPLLNTAFSGPQATFYDSLFGAGEGIYAKSKTDFEPSPLGRPTKQYAPGLGWLGSGMGVTSSWEFGISPYPNAFKWEIDVNGLPSYTSSYSNGSLTISTTADEDGNITREYTNKSGNVVCKESVVEQGISAYTYYIYDDFGQLRFVLPPMVFDHYALDQKSSFTLDQAGIDNWCFAYTYDERRRMSSKKVPSAEVVQMIYDKWDRLVLTQDGNQQRNSHWLFTKYDELNRPIMTGIVSISGHTLAQLKDLVAAKTIRFETFNGSSDSQYTDNTFPTATDGTIEDILSVTYYDDYDYLSGFELATSNYVRPSEFEGVNVDEFHLLPEYSDKTKGLITGTRTKVLGDTDYLETISFYNDKGQVIQVVSENHLGGKDVVSNQYDFSGNIRRIHKSHDTGGDTTNLTIEYEYDHANRLVNSYHKINSEDRVMLFSNVYDELGQLTQKKLHQGESSSEYQQIQDYAYNIRGWLRSINESGLSAMPQAPDPTRLFSMELIYNTSLSE